MRGRAVADGASGMETAVSGGRQLNPPSELLVTAPAHSESPFAVVSFSSSSDGPRACPRVQLATHKNPIGVTLGGCLGHAFCTGACVLGGVQACRVASPPSCSTRKAPRHARRSRRLRRVALVDGVVSCALDRRSL
jgi:hypothetical protein